MKRKEVLQLFKIKTLPTKVNKAPTGVKCIAKVSRLYNDPDFAIFKDGSCVMDKGFTHMITDVIQYYYDAPKVEVVVDKLAELQKMAAEAQARKDAEAAKGERPTEYKAMMIYIKEHKLTEEKTFGMSKEKAEELIEAYFA